MMSCLFAHVCKNWFFEFTLLLLGQVADLSSSAKTVWVWVSCVRICQIQGSISSFASGFQKLKISEEFFSSAKTVWVWWPVSDSVRFKGRYQNLPLGSKGWKYLRSFSVLQRQCECGDLCKIQGSISNFASEFQKLQIWSVETVQCVLTCSVSDSIQNQLQLHLQRNSSQPRFQPRTSSTDHDVLLFCYLPRVYNVKLKLHCTWYCIYAIYWTPDSSKCVQVFTENAQIEWFGLLFKAHLTFMRGWGQR